MLVNQIVPMDVRDRICVHAKGNTPTYLLAEKGQGKTTETIRQAVFRKAAILSTEADVYRAHGMKHINEGKPGEITFIGLGDVLNLNFDIENKPPILHMCIDNGKKILEDLLSERFGINVSIDFMSLEV